MGVFTTAPATWVASATLTAAQLNAQVRDFISGFGAWTSYTPTLSGAMTPGNGVATGFYCQVQKTVLYRAKFVLGTTSSVGTGGIQVSLPVTAIADQVGQEASGLFTISTRYKAGGYYISSTTAILYMTGTSGLLSNVTSTTPATWTTGSTVWIAGTYEAA